MQPDTNAQNPGVRFIQPVNSYPLWKRGLAVGWVIFLCVLAGGAGLAMASAFSFSGY